MKGGIFALALALGFVAAGTAHAGDTHKINGDVVVAAGQHAGDVGTVNGDIRIGKGASVREAETVNGSITLDAHAAAKSLEAVNGDVTLNSAARVREDVETVNGRITLHNDVDVRGEVSNVTGSIMLEAAHVGDGLETVAGDITVGAGSHVEGGIKVERPHRGNHRSDRHTPRIVIGPHAVVTGTLRFEREVDLHVSDSAKIGPVKGATVHRFTGDQP